MSSLACSVSGCNCVQYVQANAKQTVCECSHPKNAHAGNLESWVLNIHSELESIQQRLAQHDIAIQLQEQKLFKLRNSVEFSDHENVQDFIENNPFAIKLLVPNFSTHTAVPADFVALFKQPPLAGSDKDAIVIPYFANIFQSLLQNHREFDLRCGILDRRTHKTIAKFRPDAAGFPIDAATKSTFDIRFVVELQGRRADGADPEFSASEKAQIFEHLHSLLLKFQVHARPGFAYGVLTDGDLFQLFKVERTDEKLHSYDAIPDRHVRFLEADVVSLSTQIGCQQLYNLLIATDAELGYGSVPLKVSTAELPSICRVGDQIELVQFIGIGLHSCVFAVKLPDVENQVVMKYFTDPAALTSERDILKRIAAVQMPPDSLFQFPRLLGTVDDTALLISPLARPFASTWTQISNCLELSEWDQDHMIHATVDVFHGVLDALKCLHQNGIVHRDIKMDNVLLTFNAESQRFVVLLNDFSSSFVQGSPRVLFMGCAEHAPDHILACLDCSPEKYTPVPADDLIMFIRMVFFYQNPIHLRSNFSKMVLFWNDVHRRYPFMREAMNFQYESPALQYQFLKNWVLSLNFPTSFGFEDAALQGRLTCNLASDSELPVHLPNTYWKLAHCSNTNSANKYHLFKDCPALRNQRAEVVCEENVDENRICRLCQPR